MGQDDDFDFGDAIDLVTFDQIREMDEPGDVEFSSSIVFDFFDQAEDTFKNIEEALQKKDLVALSSLGHFLKGSSATLGLVKVRDGCEKIQRLGKHENLDGSPETDDEVCLATIEEAFVAVKRDFREAESILKEYYAKHDVGNGD